MLQAQTQAQRQMGMGMVTRMREIYETLEAGTRVRSFATAKIESAERGEAPDAAALAALAALHE